MPSIAGNLSGELNWPKLSNQNSLKFNKTIIPLMLVGQYEFIVFKTGA